MTVMMRKMPGERQREIDRETEGVYMGYPYPNFCLYAFLGAENRERNREREREREREAERAREREILAQTFAWALLKLSHHWFVSSACCSRKLLRAP